MVVKKYRTIYADPPWMEKGGDRGADNHYPLGKIRRLISRFINQ
jgi:hypothetical protein